MVAEKLNLRPEKGLHYAVIEQHKTATVFPDGYGLVQFRTQLRVLDAAFAGPVHYFGLSATVASGETIPTISDLASVPYARVPHQAFMNYRALPPSSPERCQGRPCTDPRSAFPPRQQNAGAPSEARVAAC